MGTREQLADKFCSREGLSWENGYAKEAWLDGYKAAEKRMKEVTTEIQNDYRITSIIYAFRQLIKRMSDEK